MTRDLRIGFVGLGNQGVGIARMIEGDGWPLHLWARRPASLEPLRGTSAKTEETLLDLGRSCDIVGLCVVNDDDVREVVLRDGEGILYGMGAGGVIAIHSTVHPDTCRELASLAQTRGVTVIDAPVSGGGSDVVKRTIMVGGPRQSFERCRPVFEAFGDPIRHLGPVGSGQLCKLVNNTLFIAHLKLAQAALDAASGLEMDPAETAEILKASSGASFALSALQGVSGAGVSGLLRKDLRLFQEVARAADLPASTLERVAREAIEMLESASSS